MDDIMKKSMVIYLLTDSTNGKQYVGQTTQLLRKRLREHRRKHYTYIDQAIKAHSWQNFTVEVLDECTNSDELNERERYRIATLGTRAPNGYNLTDGGNGSLGCPLTQMAKDKISATRRKRAVICVELGITFESVAKAAKWAGVTPTAIVQACRDSDRRAAKFHWIYLDGESGDEQTRQKIIASHGQRAVLCIELEQVFPSIKDAATWAGVSVSSIVKSCKDSNKLAANYHWAYFAEPFHSSETRKKIGKAHRRAVRCIETGIIFASLTEAAEWANSDVSTIINACKKINSTAGGYHWAYVDQSHS